MKKQEVISRLEEMNRKASEELDQFEKKFKANPVHAMEWSMGAFGAAAMFARTAEVLSQLSHDGASVEQALHSVEQVIAHMAKYPSFSASTSANLMDTYKLRALAEIREVLAD